MRPAGGREKQVRREMTIELWMRLVIEVRHFLSVSPNEAS